MSLSYFISIIFSFTLTFILVTVVFNQNSLELSSSDCKVMLLIYYNYYRISTFIIVIIYFYHLSIIHFTM